MDTEYYKDTAAEPKKRFSYKKSQESKKFKKFKKFKFLIK